MAATPYFGLTAADLTSADALLRLSSDTPYSSASAEKALAAAEDQALAILEGLGYSEASITAGSRVHSIARQAALNAAKADARYFTALTTTQGYEIELRIAWAPLRNIQTRPADAGADRPTGTGSVGTVETYAGPRGREGLAARPLIDRMIRARR